MKKKLRTRARKLYKQYIKRRAKFKKNHPFVIPVTAFLILFVLTSMAMVSLNATTVGASDAKLVSVFVDGTERSVVTRAETVGKLLENLKVELRTEDVVEPAQDTIIYDDNFRVTVYRARPVVIEDEGRKIVTYSVFQSAELIAERAGITIYPEDSVTLEPSQNVLEDGIAAQKIVIDRATPVTINLYGNQIATRTRSKTVSDVLAEKNIQLLEGDTLQPSGESAITKDLAIFVARFGKQIISVEEAIKFTTETTLDPNQLESYQQITQAGVDGRRLVTYEIELTNNIETSRRELQSVVALEPVVQKVIKGSKVIYSNPSANVTLGQQIAEEMGWTAEFSCIYNIFQRESGWDHLKRNRSSGAYGIPQALPGSKMGPGWESDPALQIRWGIGYMVSRYGSPCGAWSFWQVNHWY
jgi:resuscitation-promoting factor RpfB